MLTGSITIAPASLSRSPSPDAWFTYYYWLDDRRAPDFARTVEIHRKPGYDPVELFLDPAIAFPKLAIGWRLLKRMLGMRALMDVIPLDASLVRGSHGRADTPYARGPLVMSSDAALLPDGTIDATEVKQLMLDHMFGKNARTRRSRCGRMRRAMNDAAERVILVDAGDRAARHGVEARGAPARRVCTAPSRCSSTTATGNMLLQKRHPAKYHSGGLWTNACCGHPRPGEDTLAAASRRLAEEMGFACPLTPLRSLVYRADVGAGLIEHELVHIFTGVWRGEYRAKRR